MSQPLLAAQYADPKGRIIVGFDGLILLASGITVPSDTTAGFSPGCIFIDRDASAGAQFYINRGSGTSCSFKVVDTGGLDMSTLVATAAEINRIASVSNRLVTVTTTPLTLSLAVHEGKTTVITLATGCAVSLPAATGSGARYRVVIGATITSTNVTTFTCAGSDKLYGQVYQLADGGSTLAAYELPASTIITLGTSSNTTGGTLGDSLEFEDIASAKWWCVAHTTAAGTEATPVT